MQDSGKLSDMVRLTLAIADREDRTHRYGYRNVMRYQIDERDDGMVYISFWADPSDRAHEALNVDSLENSLMAKIMKVVVAEDPKLLNGDAGASGNACGALAGVMGMLMASIFTHRPEAYPHVRGKVIEKIDREASRTLETVAGFIREQAQRP